jgi:hypothetical protein
VQLPEKRRRSRFHLAQGAPARAAGVDGEQHLPPGPKSFEEVCYWARDACKRFLSKPGAAQRAHDNLAAGITISTDYSGIGTPEMSMALIMERRAFVKPCNAMTRAPAADLSRRQSVAKVRSCHILSPGCGLKHTAVEHDRVMMCVAIAAIPL